MAIFLTNCICSLSLIGECGRWEVDIPLSESVSFCRVNASTALTICLVWEWNNSSNNLDWWSLVFEDLRFLSKNSLVSNDGVDILGVTWNRITNYDCY